MKNIIIALLVVAVAILAGLLWVQNTGTIQPTVVTSMSPTPVPSPSPTSATDPLHILTPQPNELIKSPVLIQGTAPGTWFFEASFPIELHDSTGKKIATAVAQAQGEWMTTELVPFEATLTIPTLPTGTGTLVFKKDNPSGLPEHDASVELPVVFSR